MTAHHLSDFKVYVCEYLLEQIDVHDNTYKARDVRRLVGDSETVMGIWSHREGTSLKKRYATPSDIGVRDSAK